MMSCAQIFSFHDGSIFIRVCSSEKAFHSRSFIPNDISTNIPFLVGSICGYVITRETAFNKVLFLMNLNFFHCV